MKKTRYLFGEFYQIDGKLTAPAVHEICEKAEARQEETAAHPLELVYQLFDQLAQDWSDPEFPARKEAQERLPGLTGFSPEMVALGLNHVSVLLNSASLRQKVRTELRNIPRQGDPSYNLETKTMLKWYPLGTVLHVLSGNVFLVGIGSLIEGLLTGNVTILKMSSDETFFMPLFMRSLQECERRLSLAPAVSRSVALVEYSSSEQAVIAAFKDRVDGVVVWGGETAVKAYRDGLPARVRFISFGPKLSFSFCTERGTAMVGIPEVAARLATEISIWDQNACTAPQVCFVEGEEAAKALALALPEALERVLKLWPAGRLDADAAAEIQKLRSVFEISEFRGAGFYRGEEGECAYTVIYDPKGSLETSPLHRTIRIVPYDDRSVVQTQVAALRSYVQTIGVICAPDEFLELADTFASKGALKIVSLGQMSGGSIDDPHDGAYDLPQLLNLISLRMEPEERTPAPRYFNRRPSALLRNLNETLLGALGAPHYRSKISTFPVQSLAAFEDLPPLTRDELNASAFPRTEEMFSGVGGWGGQVTRSGGSTGEPNFSWFTKEDWESMVRSATVAYAHCGLRPGDKIANCFLSGDMYGSFISFNDVNQSFGLTTYPLTGAVPPETFLKLWKLFRFDVIQGMPGRILPLLRTCKELCPEFRLRKVMYAGEPLLASERTWLTGTLGVVSIVSFIGTTESGLIAYQNDECEENEFHVLEEYNYLEIVDDSGKRVPDGTTGKILVTNLAKRSYPVIRYDIGDKGRFVWKQRPDGVRERRLVYGGRHGDICAVGHLNLDLRDVETVLAKTGVCAFQLEIKDDAGVRLTFNVETPTPGPAAEEKVRMALLEQLPNFASRTQYFTFTVKSSLPGSLPRNPTTGKLRRVLDQRIAGTPGGV